MHGVRAYLLLIGIVDKERDRVNKIYTANRVINICVTSRDDSIQFGLIINNDLGKIFQEDGDRKLDLERILIVWKLVKNCFNDIIIVFAINYYFLAICNYGNRQDNTCATVSVDNVIKISCVFGRSNKKLGRC